MKFYLATKEHVDEVFALTYGSAEDFADDPIMKNVWEGMTGPMSSDKFSDVEATLWKR